MEFHANERNNYFNGLDVSTSDIYDDLRPGDMRHLYPHALAEMVRELSELTDNIVQAQENAQNLLNEINAISSGGLGRLREAGEILSEVVDASKSDIEQAIDTKVARLESAVNSASLGLREAGAGLIRQSTQAITGSVDNLMAAALRLEKAAEAAENSRLLADASRVRLMDYRKELESYESLVHRRCKEAIASASAGATLKERLIAVFRPAKLHVIPTKAPIKR
jgi:hypothetical protein